MIYDIQFTTYAAYIGDRKMEEARNLTLPVQVLLKSLEKLKM